MPDGVYQVDYGNICAGFVIDRGRVIACAPILRRRLAFWLRVGVRVSDGHLADI